MSVGAVARTLVLHAPRRLVVRALPVPVFGEDDALGGLQPAGCAGPTMRSTTGELVGGFAFVPGRETVGTVEVVGPAAMRWSRHCSTRWALEYVGE